MNANNVKMTKAIEIFRFSIFGIDGFKTVSAEGAGPKKRMRSAVNQIDRDVKQMLKDVESESELGQYRTEQLNLGAAILRKILSESSSDSFTALHPTGTIEILSTEEFFEKTDTAYAGNTAHFMKHIDDMHKRAFVVPISEVPGTPIVGAKPAVVMLFKCTGGLFGDEPFYATLSHQVMDKLGEGDSLATVKTMCYHQIRSLKSIRIADYVRATDEQTRERLKAAIIRIDELIDTVRHTQVQYLSNITSERTANTASKEGKNDSMQKVIQIMINETSTLLMDRLLLAAGSQAPTQQDD